MKKAILYLLLSWTLLGIIGSQVLPLAWYSFEKSELIEKDSETEKEVEKDDLMKKILFCVDLLNNAEAEIHKSLIHKTPHFYYPSPFTAIYIEIASQPPDVTIV
jgi:hypothetical protein